MTYIVDGFIGALKILSSFDQEIYSIIGLSIFVSFTSTMISAIFGIIFGILLGLSDFKGKSIIVRCMYAFMALPPVVVGLFVAIFISRRGPLGSLQLMFTPTAMVVAQTLLITPIISGLVYNATRTYGNQISEVCMSLGGTWWNRMVLVFFELKKSIAVAITTGFGRGISEVGAVMIVGGNIKGHTRVMTTFIAMNNSMGNYEQSIAMGLVLIGIAIVTNSVIHRLTGEEL
jgi:tungstate transport system permease protein